MKEKTSKSKKVPLNLRITEELKKEIDLRVKEYNTKGPDFPITRNDLVTLFIETGLDQWNKR